MRRTSDGSVLMLVPAAVLVLFVLGSIAVDSSIAILAQRELTSAAAAAANDAAGGGASDDAFYGGGDPGRIVLDQARAEALATAAFDQRDVQGVTEAVRTVVVHGDRVCVTITGHVDSIFAKAIPGAPRGRTVTGRAVATAVQGDDDPPSGGDPADVCRA
ncbi:MAG TPA: hypothetical protein VHM89_04255 [Acidimicrobiales bacterium]|nr:hypothetical protein [Acidimicrobiales bacterium]